MVNVNTIYGEYLKAEDLQGRRAVVTIEAARVVDFDDGKRKICLKFKGKKKAMLLNVTNSNTIRDLHGPESDAWIGKSVTVFSAVVPFQGRNVPALRVEPVIPGGLPAPQQSGASNGYNGNQNLPGHTANAPLPPPLTRALVPADEVGSAPARGLIDDEIPFAPEVR